MVGVGIGLFVDIVVGLPEQEYHGAVAADVRYIDLIFSCQLSVIVNGRMI